MFPLSWAHRNPRSLRPQERFSRDLSLNTTPSATERDSPSDLLAGLSLRHAGVSVCPAGGCWARHTPTTRLIHAHPATVGRKRLTPENNKFSVPCAFIFLIKWMNLHSNRSQPSAPVHCGHRKAASRLHRLWDVLSGSERPGHARTHLFIFWSFKSSAFGASSWFPLTRQTPSCEQPWTHFHGVPPACPASRPRHCKLQAPESRCQLLLLLLHL